PDYMIPTTYTPLDTIPLNANGKTNHKALPTPDRDELDAAREHVAPSTATERRLAEIWAEVLGVERIGATDSFFELGGHSILIIKVVSAARQADLPLSLMMFYRHDTLGELAAELDGVLAAERPAGPSGESVTRSAPSGGSAAVSRSAPRSLLDTVDTGRVPGVSIAVIEGGELVAAETLGTLVAGGAEPVTPETLFQVGSVSKHVTALGVLRLAQDGVIDLDEDVNTYLKGWRVPGVDGGRPPRITSRQLLGHLSGLTPTLGKGYRRGEPLPGLVDLLNGRTSDGARPVRPDLVPGEVFRKANVHFSVLQQVVVDATGRGFAELMHSLLFAPLGMTGTSFDQSFPETSGLPVAHGHDELGSPLAGGWLVRADAAAAGLWTTAVDLAKLALEVRRSYLGRPLALLGQDSARELLTPHDESFYGLGTVVDTLGADVQYGHGGEPIGYHALTVSLIQRGSGLVVLTNSSGGGDLIKAVADTR
ncbi:serine hydrolase, partial [Kitasatospora sp. NPDC056651]|uniref:serine hydrolase domain-containing protein n=1 Tax=Kitasatospora sp. NPDC056651 TaxID=3345892 RepID=UPI00368251E2